jgi:hypothetical protein
VRMYTVLLRVASGIGLGSPSPKDVSAPGNPAAVRPRLDRAADECLRSTYLAEEGLPVVSCVSA